METPTGIMKEDWSLAAHFLAEIYEEQPDVEAFITSLHEGTADLANNEKFNSLMDFFDVMMENNYAKDSAIAAERETTEMMLAEGQIAFLFGGNWDWSVINAYDYTENMGMMPVPQNTDDGSNEKLVGGGSKFMMIDSLMQQVMSSVRQLRTSLHGLLIPMKDRASLLRHVHLYLHSPTMKKKYPIHLESLSRNMQMKQL